MADQHGYDCSIWRRKTVGGQFWGRPHQAADNLKALFNKPQRNRLISAQSSQLFTLLKLHVPPTTKPRRARCLLAIFPLTTAIWRELSGCFTSFVVKKAAP